MGRIIYRYINWEDSGSQKLLTESELYFYPASKWNDDGEYDLELADFTEDKIFDFILERAVYMHNNYRTDYEQWMNENAKKYMLI